MSTSARFNDGLSTFPGLDNTDRIRNNAFLQPAYTSTIAIVPQTSYILVKPATLTGAVTFTIGVGSTTTPPYVGDKVEFLLVSDGTTRTATFGTGFTSTGTLAVTTAKYASISFMFNGTNWQEVGRVVTA